MSIEKEAFVGCEAMNSVTVLNEQCSMDHALFETFSCSVIRGYAGSTAEIYAKEHSKTFEEIHPSDKNA